MPGTRSYPASRLGFRFASRDYYHEDEDDSITVAPVVPPIVRTTSAYDTESDEDESKQRERSLLPLLVRLALESQPSQDLVHQIARHRSPPPLS